MWQLENSTPFAAERGWARDRDGAEVWLVAVKATFDIAPDGTTAVSAIQPPVLRIPEYHGEAAMSSIRYEADLVLAKKTTDIIVVGNAHAPGGQPVTQCDAGFRVGPLQKVVRIFGDRHWAGGRLSEPEPFTVMPIVYERAYGGLDSKSARPDRDWDWRNPVGCGFAAAKEHLAGMAAPNVEFPDSLIAAWDDRPEPAGFGAFAGHWQPRAAFAGTYDDAWMRERQPLPPADFDERFYQCAPRDQQAAQFLKGGEPVALVNLSPHGRLQFALPKVRLGFETRFFDGSSEVHTVRNLHTVIIEPEFPRVSLVWHSALPCHFKVQLLERTTVTLKDDLSAGGRPGAPVGFAVG
ncbi:DUF2169 family type VI secretion system accessory protein [Pseudoduganella albidiflava]|uniref:DUF2169 domain-containing protein n=1 Tax=Pseudoduganella albidiflava TaxID=321983 RepID=A0A411WXG8_9BURK|nr:DUF2169 domain-containing protein [Pseudoduganella albidiflava]QBI01287.1 DUF2169 domain-containing protein [Pseudoduganella albidiflava]GGY36875.1 hypothetical protein GCM10007387_19020 [Pseudoduganella albidiflava]